MLYFKCPTCKTTLANKQIPYEERMDKICNNMKLSVREKDKLKDTILDELCVIRYCCRMRVMGYVRLIDELV
jgi:DNA-directed RNA polymerase subunit N (RpoN/RPB10)